MNKKVLVFPVLFLCNLLFAQIASYNFDNNVNDQTNSYHGVISGNISYETVSSETFINRSVDSYITLPVGLSQQLVNDSFKISFDYKSSSNDINKAIVTNSANVNGHWDTAGFTVLQTGGELVLTIDDGIQSDDYTWIGIGTIGLNEWKNFTLRFQLDAKKVFVDINGVLSKTIELPNSFDKSTFKQAIQSRPITIGGMNSSVNTEFFNGPFSLDNLLIFESVLNLPALTSAFVQLTNHLTNSNTLTQNEITNLMNTIKNQLYFANYSDIKTDMFAFTDAYENAKPPLYNDGVGYLESELPSMDRALLYVQEYIFETRFTSENVASTAGIVFEHHKVIPGEVAPGAVNVNNANVTINGTYNTDIAAIFTDQSRVVRPTGYYVKPGDLVTITVPAEIVNSGVSIIVGAHFRNMDEGYIGKINRFSDISAEYEISTTNVTVANPFGGAIYFKIPDGTNKGSFTCIINNAIKMPYFSYRSGAKTSDSDWLAQVASSKAPWADFESDKFMFSIPVSFLTGVTNPTEIMKKWDESMDAIRTVAGRPAQRPRAEYYSFDTRLVTPAYGAGYPLIIPISEMATQDLWNPLKVLEGPRHTTLLHEMGHNHLHPTLGYGPSFDQCAQIEAETIVHTLAFAVNHLVYNMNIKDSFAYSRSNIGTDPFTLEEAAFDWIITTNFRQNLPMDFDNSVPMSDKDMLKYQPRGWAKYADLAGLFGMQALSDTNGSFYNPGQAQPDIVCPDRGFITDRDDYIEAASTAVGKNLAPFFHFWGIQPSTSTTNNVSSLPKSQKVKELIEYYQCNVAPLTMNDYLVYHNTIFPNTDYQWPRYQQYINEFDSAFAQAIQDQFTFILNEYGLVGLPAPTDVQGSFDNNVVNLSWSDNSTGETGFVVKMKGPQETSFSIIGTTAANATSFNTPPMSDSGTYEFRVTALNSDNLESNSCEVETLSLDSGTLSNDDIDIDRFKLYPNPTQNSFTISGNLEELHRVDLYNIQGKLIKTITKDFDYMSLNGLSSGLYYVKLNTRNHTSTKRLIKK